MSNKMIIGNLIINASLQYDAESGDVLIEGLTHEFVKAKSTVAKACRTLNGTEEKFKIVTLGSNNEVAPVLPLSTDFTLVFQDKEYAAKSHSSTKGRFTSKDFFSEWSLKEGTIIEVSYIPTEKVMHLEVISLPEDNGYWEHGDIEA